MVVILASSTYGRATNDLFDTGREMKFVLGEKKDFFLIRVTYAADREYWVRF